MSTNSKENNNEQKKIKELKKSLNLLKENNIIDTKLYEELNNKISTSNNEKLIELNDKEITDLNSKTLVQVINLSKKYNKKSNNVIDNLNFEIKSGEFHAFIGANGAGKTTTIKAIVGAYAKFDGKIIIDGFSNYTSIAKERIGYIAEKAVFPKNLNTLEYLATMAILSGISKKEAFKLAENKLKELNMENLYKKNPNNFSSGQKKKVLLTQALINNPKILIMDEPAANLDPIARIELFDLLKQLQSKGVSIFISSHILAELDKYADHVTILDGGKIVYTGKINHDVNLESLYLKFVKKGSIDNPIKIKN